MPGYRDGAWYWRSASSLCVLGHRPAAQYRCSRSGALPARIGQIHWTPFTQPSRCTYFTSVSGQLTQWCQPASAESEMLNSSQKVQPLLGRLGIQIRKEKSLLGLSHSSKKAAFCWVGYWETLAVTVSPAEGKKGFAFCPSRVGLPSYTFLEVRKPSEAATVSPPTRRNQGYSFCLMLNPTEFLGERRRQQKQG